MIGREIIRPQPFQRPWMFRIPLHYTTLSLHIADTTGEGVTKSYGIAWGDPSDHSVPLGGSAALWESVRERIGFWMDALPFPTGSTYAGVANPSFTFLDKDSNKLCTKAWDYYGFWPPIPFVPANFGNVLPCGVRLDLLWTSNDYPTGIPSVYPGWCDLQIEDPLWMFLDAGTVYAP